MGKETVTRYLRLLRPYQYVKNGFIFLPLFFAQKITHWDLFGKTCLAFVCFCLVSSSIYVVNDYWDREEDRQHPVKKQRPLAAGTINPSLALGLAGVLGVLGLSIAYWLEPNLLIILMGYGGMNLVYTLILKHVSLIDVFVIALGFVLRLFAGGVVGQVEVRMWIILMTFLLALFLALAKRREDVILVNAGQQVRKSMNGYNLEFVTMAMTLMAPVIVVSYIFYTISSEVTQRFHSNYLYLTVIFVLLGILRYLQMTLVENRSGDPTEILLTDRFLQGTILGWLGTFILLIY